MFKSVLHNYCCDVDDLNRAAGRGKKQVTFRTESDFGIDSQSEGNFKIDSITYKKQNRWVRVEFWLLTMKEASGSF